MLHHRKMINKAAFSLALLVQHHHNILYNKQYTSALNTKVAADRNEPDKP